jgi:hypothetical protein
MHLHAALDEQRPKEVVDAADHDQLENEENNSLHV